MKPIVKFTRIVKSNFYLTFVQIIVVLTFSLRLPLITADEVILVADEWCPFNCTPNSDKPGFLIELAKYSLAKKGHTVKYIREPWQRAIRQVRSGEYQGLVGAAIGDSPEFIFPKQPLISIKNSFYVLKENNWKYTDIDSLKKINLGIINHYDYGEDINTYILANGKNKSLLTTICDDLAADQLIKLLTRNRIDAFIGVKSIIEMYGLIAGESPVIKEVGVLSIQDIYISFSPNHPKSQEYADAISEGLTELRLSGKLEKLLEKYSLLE